MIFKRMRLIQMSVALLAAGCAAPSGRLSFPRSPIDQHDNIEWYDPTGTGSKTFGIAMDNGRIDRLLYDDNADGRPDRIYRLSDYANEDVPQAILLLDSVPFEALRQRYQAGDFRWFDPPQKLIAPFPSLTEVCYTDLLHAPPLPGVINQYYDPRTHRRNDAMWRRVRGEFEPWERRCNYIADFMDQGLSFLDPHPWYHAELERAHKAIDESPDRVTVVYLASAASLACKCGRPGVDEILDGARQLCLQLLYERRGAIKITMMADHGHNYAVSTNVSLDAILRAGGYHPADSIEDDNDVVVEINGLVTCSGLHTRKPAAVAELMVKQPTVELAMYLEQDRAIVRSAAGTAAIECRNGRLRYRPIDADVLDLSPLVEDWQRRGLADADGFSDDLVWFEQTIDHNWPNAPGRIWDALHRQVVNPPDVLLSIRDGYCTGLPQYERFIKMQSTHGGLNQINSATFIMTMTGRLHGPMRHQDVLRTVAPGFEPRLVR